MNQQTAVILGAAIAALVAFCVALYNSRRQSKLEYEKWLRTREDQIDKDFRLAVADLTRKIAQGTHQIIWLAWKAKNEPTNLTEEDFVMYDKKMGELFPDIVGSRIIVAALNRKVHDEITPFVKRLYILDEEVAKARILFRKMPEKSIATLAELPKHFAPDGFYGEPSVEADAPGYIPDIVDFSKIVCFGISGDGAPFCFDFRDNESNPSVIWWDDVYWRRVAPDFASFLELFDISRAA